MVLLKSNFSMRFGTTFAFLPRTFCQIRCLLSLIALRPLSEMTIVPLVSNPSQTDTNKGLVFLAQWRKSWLAVLQFRCNPASCHALSWIRSRPRQASTLRQMPESTPGCACSIEQVVRTGVGRQDLLPSAPSLPTTIRARAIWYI